MLRLHSRCTPDVIGGYIGGEMIQSLQCIQDVPTGFQDTLPPVTRVVTMPAVLPEVIIENRICFDRFDSPSPLSPPVVGDAQDVLHEDLKINKNSTLKIFADVVVVIFADVVVVIFALVSLDSVRIALLPLAD